MKKGISFLLLIAILLPLIITTAGAESSITYFVANSDIISLVEYGHVEKDAFVGEGSMNLPPLKMMKGLCLLYRNKIIILS